ncbi:hypothetical protein C8R47DRAFT_1150688 [Mycena vitilis]|nr:hypothetical protein C8R47DRAFT_1150688 [Mycena vitilis]
MSLIYPITRRVMGPTANTFRNYDNRKSDRGIVGNWPRKHEIFRVSGFDATRLLESDFIDVPRSSMVYLDVHGHYPTHGQQVPFYALSFRASDSRYTRRTSRRSGFFHYHVPIPDRPFSGGLRFRCAPSLAAFAEGTDLLCPSGLPFAVPFANLVRRTSLAVTQSLLRDNLVTFPDILACHASFHNKPHPELPVVHAVGQPIYLHFRQPTVLLVPGPHSLIRCELYPAVAQYGSALVCLEFTDNPNSPHEVALRVLELRSGFRYLPQFAHLPPLTPGSLLVRPDTAPGAEPIPWTWNYDSYSARMAAGLYTLVNGPVPLLHNSAHDPFTQASDEYAEAGMFPDLDTDVAYPTRGQRQILERLFYGALPRKDEVARYGRRGR